MISLNLFSTNSKILMRFKKIAPPVDADDCDSNSACNTWLQNRIVCSYMLVIQRKQNIFLHSIQFAEFQWQY